MFLSASHGAPHVHVVMLALEQYATRANCAGRWSVLFTTSKETGVGAPVAESSPVDAPRPKIGRDSAPGRTERSGIIVRASISK
jgi:hypothetical protein